MFATSPWSLPLSRSGVVMRRLKSAGMRPALEVKLQQRRVRKHEVSRPERGRGEKKAASALFYIYIYINRAVLISPRCILLVTQRSVICNTGMH